MNILENSSRIMVFNAKGGTGKTAIALNLALTCGYGLLTNDRLTVVDSVLKDDRYTILEKDAPLPTIPDDWPIVFDFGGFPDSRAIQVMKKSQYILIPILPHKENMQASIDFIKEITEHKYQPKIIIIVNQTTGDQYKAFKETLEFFFPKIKTFNIKKSSAFAWMIEHKLSIAELAVKFKQHARHFQPVADQFRKILDYMGKCKQ